jgi:deoxyribodipyrimidine photolyase-related protein
MADYYQHQRKRLGILLEDDGESPVGGKWSFDEENRKKVPKKLLKQLPQLPRPVQGEAVEEARKYVEKHFADNYGQTDAFFYPTTHQAARAWLDDFLAQRFAQFGPYEDAIVEGESLLYHSLLTPMLNIGLLQPAGRGGSGAGLCREGGHSSRTLWRASSARSSAGANTCG